MSRNMSTVADGIYTARQHFTCHMNESCRMWWVMSHIGHTNESCHIWMSRVTHKWVMSLMKELCHLSRMASIERVPISHVTCMNKRYNMHDCNMSHIWTSHVTCTDESCHTFVWIMSPARWSVKSHVWLSHTHCHALQNIATRCNTLQHRCVWALLHKAAPNLQRTATHCNTLQHTATHCMQWCSTGALERCTTWLRCTCSSSRSGDDNSNCVMTHSTCDMTHSYMRYDSLICVTWTHSCICDMTHPYMRHDAFIHAYGWVMSHVCMSHVAHAWMRSCHMYSCVWHDSFMNTTWLIHTCDMDPFMHVTCDMWHGTRDTCTSRLAVATTSVLQCVAVCCSVLKCVAVCCNGLQCVAVLCSVLQWVAVCCSMLQCVAVCAVCCSVLQCVAVRCSVLQCAAVGCSVLQYVAVCCSVLQCVAVYCSVLQYVAVCCSVLQCVAVFCSGDDDSNCVITYPYVWHDSFIRQFQLWLIHTCDITYSYIWRDSFIHACQIYNRCMNESCHCNTLQHTSYLWHVYEPCHIDDTRMDIDAYGHMRWPR